MTLCHAVMIRKRVGSKGPPIGNGLWGIQWSRDRCRALKGQTRDVNTLRAQTCYLETTANYLLCVPETEMAK